MPSDLMQAVRTGLRVVLVSNFYPPYVVGGAELVAAHLARELAATGVDVTVVTTCGPQEGMREEVEDGVHIIRFFPRNLWWNYARFQAGDARSLPAKLVWNLRDGWNRDAARKFGALLESLAPDIVHTHNIKGFSPSIWSEARKRRLPVVHTMHDYYLLCSRGTMLDGGGRPCGARCIGCRLYRQWYKPQAAAVDVLCSPSRHLLDVHMRAGITGRLGDHVVRNGLPQPSSAGDPRKDGPLRLLFLGQLRREKGVHLVLEAMSRLRQPVEVHIAGRGPLTDAVRRAAEGDPRISFLGFIGGEDKDRELAWCDAMLFPSTWAENAPLAIAEAFLHGKPLVASRFGAIPEFVCHGHNGLLFEMGNATALAAAIDRLAVEPGLLASLGAGALESGASCSAQAMTAGYRGLYELVLEKGQVAA